MEWAELELLALVLWLTDLLTGPGPASEAEEADIALVLGLQDPVLMVRDLGGVGDTPPLSVSRTLRTLPDL